MAGATEILGRSFEERSYYTELEDLKISLDALLRKLDDDQRHEYELRLDMSWIHHDGAIEGQVLSPQEIWTALNTQVRSDTAFQPAITDVRAHRTAIEYARSLVDKKKVTVGPELLRRLYNTLASEDEQCTGALVYRKDIPIHRTYFHEIVPPAKLAGQMKRFFGWARDPNLRKLHPLYFGSAAHYRLMRIFPFTHHTGKLSRLIMNLILLRGGYPPAIVHSTDRQNYYEAIRDGYDATFDIVSRALRDVMLSNVQLLEKY